jgi:hypothetical protein
MGTYHDIRIPGPRCPVPGRGRPGRNPARRRPAAARAGVTCGRSPRGGLHPRRGGRAPVRHRQGAPDPRRRRVSGPDGDLEPAGFAHRTGRALQGGPSLTATGRRSSDRPGPGESGRRPSAWLEGRSGACCSGPFVRPRSDPSITSRSDRPTGPGESNADPGGAWADPATVRAVPRLGYHLHREGDGAGTTRRKTSLPPYEGSSAARSSA